ncbi:MAG: ATP synthase F0 subunit C [Minisyncoccia bacterium]
MDVEAAKYYAEGMKYLGQGLIILSMFGTAIGQGLVVSKALEAIGRNPDVQGSIFSKMIVGVAMIEAIAIYALVAFFVI